MSSLIIAIHIFASIFLICLVLLQSGKGSDIGAALGGGGSSQSVFGTRRGNVLTKATTVLAILFMVTSLTITVIKSHPASIIKESGGEGVSEQTDTQAEIVKEKGELPPPKEMSPVEVKPVAIEPAKKEEPKKEEKPEVKPVPEKKTTKERPTQVKPAQVEPEPAKKEESKEEAPAKKEETKKPAPSGQGSQAPTEELQPSTPKEEAKPLEQPPLNLKETPKEPQVEEPSNKD